MTSGQTEGTRQSLSPDAESGGQGRGEKRDRRALWALVAILCLAAAIRAATINFGLPALNDQDELMFELGAIRMLRGLTFNPGWFGHPATTTMYVLAVVNALTYLVWYLSGWVSNPSDFAAAIYHDPTWMILPGRSAIMGFGLLTIALTYRLGKRLFGVVAGLIAALLLALDPLHVTYSQIIRSDMMACAFMLLAMLAALRVADRGRTRDFAIAGLWTGIAIATKWPFALSLLAVAGAALQRLVVPGARRGSLVAKAAMSALVAVAALIVASPYLVLDWPVVARNLNGEKQLHHLGATGGTPGWNAWWYLSDPLVNALGPVGLVLAGAGCIAIVRDSRARAVITPVAIAFVAVFSFQNLVWARWALPLLPLLAIGAGAAAVQLIQATTRYAGPRLAALGTVALALAVCLPLSFTLIGEGRERINDTRQQASAWLVRHVPSGKTILVEHFAWDLVETPYKFLWPVGTVGCIDARSLLTGKVSYQIVDKLRESRSNIDYGTVARDRIATCRADYAILSQYDRYAAERRYFPVEYGNYQELLRRGRTVALFKPHSGEAGGWIVRIVQIGDQGSTRPEDRPFVLPAQR